MNFGSAIFMFAFLPIAVIGHLILKDNIKNAWLLLCSVVFYAWAQPAFLLLLLAELLLIYVAGIILDKVKRDSARKTVFVISVVLIVSTLLYYKYFNFCVETINGIWHTEIELFDIVLPIGISFYTFKNISYISDVYHKRVAGEKKMLNLSVYVCMFPLILSGPIERYGKVKEKISERSVSREQMVEGIERFILGLSQKMIIANSLGIVVDDIWSRGAGAISLKTAWLGSIAYSLQIFFDFAGYSSMAVGLGKMLGFEFSENFDLPYVSTSITEFWRRWHITLGEWFKNYIYIPLGGSRKSRVRTYINLAVVFLVTGIWHGASWNFIVWGSLHGACRLLEKFYSDHFSDKIRMPEVLKQIAGHVYVLFGVNFGWVLFRAPNLKEAWKYIKSMMGILSDNYCGISVRYYLNRWNVFVLLIALLFCTGIPSKTVRKVKAKMNTNAFCVTRDVTLLILLILSIIEIVTNTYNTFIYFQF